MCSQKTRHTKDSFNSSYSCSKEESRVHKKIPCSAVPSRVSVEHSCYSSYSCSQEKSRVLQSFPAQAWNIRVIRVIRVQKKNLVFTRRISCPPVLSRASVENSCYSSSQEKSRVHKKNLVSSSPFSRKRRKFVLFELFVFKRKIPCSQEIYPCSHPHAKIIKIQ